MNPLLAITHALTSRALTSRELRADLARALEATRPAGKYLSGYVRAAADLGLIVGTMRRGEGWRWHLAEDVPVSRETSRGVIRGREIQPEPTSRQRELFTVADRDAATA